MYRMMTVVTIVALLLVATVAFGQTARYMAMGGAGIAAADDAGAVSLNPANLASLNIAPPAGLSSSIEKPWDWQVAGSIEVGGDLDYKALHLAGCNSQNKWGIGAAWQQMDVLGIVGVDLWSVGFGAEAGHRWSWGLSAQNLDLELLGLSGSETLFSGGMLFEIPIRNGSPIRIGLTATDLTDETNVGPWFSIGASTMLAEGVLLSADMVDVTDEIDSYLNIGLECGLSDNSVLRAGLSDGDITAGLGYDGGVWKLDVAWLESGTPVLDDEIIATFSCSFK